MKAVFLDYQSLDRDDLDLAALHASLELTCHDHTQPDQVTARCQGMEVVIANKTPITADTLAACPDLRLIQVAATGTNNVDLAAASRHGVTVCNVQGYATPSVVQHVFALILQLTTHLPAYTAAARSRWHDSQHFCLLDYPIRELAGQKMGIIGYGELGHAVGRMAECFGMELLIAQSPHHRQAGRLPLADIISEADVLTLHCPLTERTRGLIGETELKAMKNSALLINAARGGIVDEGALLTALRQNWIAGAALDVLTQEPPPVDHPLLNYEGDNLIVTPHIAWASQESRQRLVDQMVENVRAFACGETKNVVMVED